MYTLTRKSDIYVYLSNLQAWKILLIECDLMFFCDYKIFRNT